MHIAEIFASIQGEGQYAGTPSVFVRTTGCNLRCWFCDTPYTSWSPEGFEQPWQRVLEQVLASSTEHVVVTGGEPLLQPDVVPLSKALRDAGRFVTIETAATIDRPVEADLMSLSPKLANSTPDDAVWSTRHERVRQNDEVVRRLTRDYPYQLKFVVDRPADLAEIENWLRRFPQVASEAVWLMPQSRTPEEYEERAAWLAPEAARRGWQLSRRWHIELYGNVRGR